MANITLAKQLVNSGETYRESELAEPLFRISENLKLMRHTSMLRGDDTTYRLKGNGEFTPYDPDGEEQSPGSILARTLSTYHSELFEGFDPENIYKTLFDKPLSKSKITMPIVKAILVEDIRTAASKLNFAIWSGVRNPNGKNSLSNFNGFDTIVAMEKAGQNESETPTITKALGNYMQLGRITPYNVGDRLKLLWSTAFTLLKESNEILYMFMPESVRDMYIDWCTNHSNQSLAAIYVEGFNGVYLHNTNKKCVLVCPPGTDNIKHIILTSKKNLRIGTDGIGEGDNATGEFLLRLHGTNPRKVQMYVDCWMGVNFEAVTKEYLMCGSFTADTSVVNASTDVESIDFGEVTSGQTDTEDITVEGLNLTSSLQVTVNGGDGKFTVNKSTITAEEAMADGGQAVTVTFAPTAAGAKSATVIIASATDDIYLEIPVTGTGKV